jgi:hypothetical protein
MLFEFLRERVDIGAAVLGEELHLPPVALRLTVALEAVLVAALLLAHLAVPAELLQALGLDRVANRLQASDIVLGHAEGRSVGFVLPSR